MLHIAKNTVEPFDFYGLTIADYTRQSLDSASFAEITVAPGATHPTTRSARSDKIYYCLAGPIAFVVEGKEIVLRTADLLVIARNEWFSYANTSNHEARILLVHVPSFDLAAEEFQNP